MFVAHFIILPETPNYTACRVISKWGIQRRILTVVFFSPLPPPPSLANIMLCFMEMDQNATCAVNTELWSSFKSYFSPHIVFFWNKPSNNFRTWSLRPKHHLKLPASLSSSFSRWLTLPLWPCVKGKIRLIAENHVQGRDRSSSIHFPLGGGASWPSSLVALKVTDAPTHRFFNIQSKL